MLRLNQCSETICYESTRAPDRYISSLDYIMLIDSKEPSCYKEAMKREDKLKWEKANTVGNGFVV